MNGINSLNSTEFLRVLDFCKNFPEKKGFGECYILSRELDPFLKAVSSYHPQKDEVLKIQIVFEEVWVDTHYSSLYLEMSSENNKAFLIDSVCNKHDEMHAEALFQYGFKTIYAVDNSRFHPQHDSKNCALFAFDFGCQNRKNAHLFEDLSRLKSALKGSISYINWQDLTPNYLKLFQTRMFFETYPNLEKASYNKKKTLKQKLHYQEGKNQNVLLKQTKYRQRINKALRNPLFKEEISSIAQKDPIQLFTEKHLQV